MKKAIIWGLGKNYAKYAYIYKDYTIVALTDGNPVIRAEFEAKNQSGIPVIDPQKIKEFDFDVVLVTPLSLAAKDAIVAALLKCGVKSQKIKCLALGSPSLGSPIEEFIALVRARSVAIYGLGYYARKAYELLELYGLKPLCFAEGDLYQDDKNEVNGLGIPIIPLDEAVNEYPNALFWLGYDGEVRWQAYQFYTDRYLELDKRGCFCVSSYFSPMQYEFLLDNKDYFFPSESMDDKEICKDDLFCIDDFDEVILQGLPIRGGSLLLNYLFSDHPSLISLPIYFILLYQLTEAYITTLRFMSGLPLAIEILSYCKLNYGYMCDENKWYDEHGHEIPYGQSINKNAFVKYFCQYILDYDGSPDFGYIFKALHAAYANSIGILPNKAQKYKIYHHAHLWHFTDAFLAPFFSKVSVVCTIREPLRASYSQWGWHATYTDVMNGSDDPLEIIANQMYVFPYSKFEDDCFCYYRLGENTQYINTGISRHADPFDYIDFATREICEYLKNANIVLIRFEDLKSDLKGTMQKAAEMLGLPFDDILLRQTQAGFEIFNKGAPNSTFLSYKDPGQLITATSREVLNSVDFGTLFNHFDLFRIEMIFKGFSEIGGYKTDSSIPDLSCFDNETLIKLFSFHIKPVHEMIASGKANLENVSLYFMLFFYLQSKITQAVVTCSDKKCLVETENKG